MAECLDPVFLRQCRICCVTKGKLLEIFGERGVRSRWAESINMCLPITVTVDDSFPKLICLDCVAKLQELVTFHTQCWDSYKYMMLLCNRFGDQVSMKEKESKQLPEKSGGGECSKSPIATANNETSGNEDNTPVGVDVSEENSTVGVDVSEENSPAGADMSEEDSLVSVDITEENSEVGDMPYNLDVQSSCEVQIGQPGPEEYVLMKEESFILNTDEETPDRTTAIEFQRSSIHECDKDILLLQKKRREVLPQMWDVYEKTMKSKNVMSVTHRRYIINKSAFPCSLCGKCFDINQGVSTDRDVNKGVRTASKDEENNSVGSFPCHVCDKTFPHCNLLKRHLQIHFNYKLFACTLCGRAFSRKEHLTRHTLSHTGGRPYHCDVCNKLFTRKEHLTRHRLSHPLSIKQEDETRFSTDQAGSAHMMDTLRPFSCEFCGHCFSRKDHLNQHQRRMHPFSHHNGDPADETKPYMCCICKKNFTRKEHLVRHQGIHVREFILENSETVTGENLVPLVSSE